MRMLRQDAGFSLRDLAGAVGVSSAYLSRVEHGHDAPPTPERLRSIATVLGVPVELFQDLTGRARATRPDSSAAIRTLVNEVERRGLGPAQIGRILEFIGIQFPTQGAAPRTQLGALLSPHRVMLNVIASTVEDALDLVAMRIGAPGDAAQLALELRRREATNPSGVGGGLLLPHVPTGEPAACLLLLAEPLPGWTPDGEPIRVILALTGTGTGTTSLTLLASAARLGERSVLDQLTRTTSPEEAVEVLRRLDV